LKSLKDVILVAATNRPDILDPALIRAGRFEKQIEIGLPDKEVREKILKIHLRGLPLDNDVDLKSLALDMKGKTGADIESLCKEAVQLAIREYISNANYEDISDEDKNLVKIKKTHFDRAMKSVNLSSKRSEKAYQGQEGALSKDLYA
jgi:transitional endoplasmic reticulum ATPase